MRLQPRPPALGYHAPGDQMMHVIDGQVEGRSQAGWRLATFKHQNFEPDLRVEAPLAADTPWIWFDCDFGFWHNAFVADNGRVFHTMQEKPKSSLTVAQRLQNLRVHKQLTWVEIAALLDINPS